jgi:hypothetical protein
VVYDVARQLGIDKALGPGQEGRLALWQVSARVIDQGSRLSAVRLAMAPGACDVLGLERFNEEDLYQNLDWLYAHQAEIEDRLFRSRATDSSSSLFLYDVTSRYLEGEQNALAAFGYNRDGKLGKPPSLGFYVMERAGRFPSSSLLAIPKTFTSQIKKGARRFGGKEVTFVGDRGMSKSQQIEALGDQQFHYITAITKPQIEGLLKNGVLQIGLFDETLAQVSTEEDIRYILRRNPERVEQIARTREEQYQTLAQAVAAHNHYLCAHPRARVEVALRTLESRSQKLRIADWVKLCSQGREILLTKDPQTRAEIATLDGCSVLKTDLSEQTASKEVIHDRDKDLALVEWAFRELWKCGLSMCVGKAVHVAMPWGSCWPT